MILAAIVRLAQGRCSCLAAALNAPDADDIAEIERKMDRLREKGVVHRDRRQRWGMVQRMDLVRGRVEGNRDGYGFLISASTPATLTDCGPASSVASSSASARA